MVCIQSFPACPPGTKHFDESLGESLAMVVPSRPLIMLPCKALTPGYVGQLLPPALFAVEIFGALKHLMHTWSASSRAKLIGALKHLVHRQGFTEVAILDCPTLNPS